MKAFLYQMMRIKMAAQCLAHQLTTEEKAKLYSIISYKQ